MQVQRSPRRAHLAMEIRGLMSHVSHSALRTPMRASNFSKTVTAPRA